MLTKEKILKEAETKAMLTKEEIPTQKQLLKQIKQLKRQIKIQRDKELKRIKQEKDFYEKYLHRIAI